MLMTDGGAAFQAGRGERSLPFRPRSAYVGHEVFGHGDGAVLVEPDIARDLRSAAESASQERRIAGGLLYGRGWTDDEGAYLVVDGFLEAGPGENRGDRISRDGHDSFTLSATDLRLLRQDAARMYSATLQVGWWRSLPGPGEFSPRDLVTQRELVGPGGVGLLVFGSGLDWGTAYLGPDGRIPDSARSFIPVPRPAPEPPTLILEPEPDPEPATEPVAAIPSGSALATRRQPVLTPPPQPTGSPVISPVRVPAKEWGAKPANSGYAESRWPTDVKIVVGALIIVALVAATMVGVLVSNALVAVIIGVVGLIAIAGFLWMARL